MSFDMTSQTRMSGYGAVKGYDEDSPSKMAHKDASTGAAMKRVALLVDGMARAAILPFGPRLIHRLTLQRDWFGASSELDSATWSHVAFPMAVVIGVYTLGRSVGVYTSQHLHLTQAKLPQHVARLGGLAFALHLFTLGAGLHSVRWLVMIRFLSAMLTGLLCGLADFSLPEDKLVGDVAVANKHHDELMEEGLVDSEAEKEDGMKKRSSYMDVTPASAKIYMTGFAISILTGGLLHRHIATSAVIQALTGAYPLTLSPLFFVAVTAATEFVLRCVFFCSSDRINRADNNARSKGKEGGPVKRFVRGVVNRRVRISNTTTSYSPDASFLRNHHSLQDKDDIEFYDPLNISRHQSQQDYRGTPNRMRLNSARSETSMSEFFDCNSTLNDEIIDLDADLHTCDAGDHENVSESAVAVYKDGRCVYPDGSPAFVPPGICIANVPQNYLDFYRGNKDKAFIKYKETQDWRKEENVWEIHRLPHPMFERIKEAYPHIIHGHSKTGQVVIYENPGKMNLKQLFRSGCEVSDMLMHMTFFLEYIGNCVSTRSEVRELNGGALNFGTVVVMDVRGASVTSLTGDVLRYLSQSGALQSAHYPNVLKRVFVVNCPFWLAGAWSTVKGIVPESVHVEILSESNALEAMRKYIDDDQIPEEYGGSSPFALGEHPYEIGCFEVAEKAGTFARNKVVDSIPEKPFLGTSHSLDHSEQQLFHDDPAECKMVSSAPWRTELEMSSLVSPSEQPLRRRTSSQDLPGEQDYQPLRRRASSQGAPEEQCFSLSRDSDSRVGEAGDEGEILFLVSFMYTAWCAVQGAIEVAVPLWMVSPALLGGLGYAPSRSGMVLFSISLVLLCLMRTKVAHVVSQIPSKAPMRAFRIAVGSEAVILSILFIVPSYTT